MKDMIAPILLLTITTGILIWIISDSVAVIGFTKVLELLGIMLLGSFLISLPFWFKPLQKWMDKGKPIQ